MNRAKLKAYVTLIKRLAILAGIGIAAFFLYRFFSGSGKEDGFLIDDTPLRVEQIREIVELNTIDFRDEVVVDSVEYYRTDADRLLGTSQKFQQDFSLDLSNIKRRLTLIVKGELLYGIDLKRKELLVESNDSTLTVTIPEPALLSVNLSPENTEVFIENGDWKDYERRHLETKAKIRMIRSGERLKLAEKAKEPVEKLLRKLIVTEKKLVIRYY